MLNKDILYKRLSHIKQLFNIGIGQSSQHENIAVFSILAFHDSIEMFLKLLAEHKGINASKFSFLDYWGKIPDLTLKESMRNLNARRVNIKHKGLLPAKSEIEISKVNAIDFFNQNTIKQFDIEFTDVSLIELIGYKKVKEYLNKSQTALNTGNTAHSIENCAYAFEELLHTYEKNKSVWGDSPFSVGADMTFMSSFSMGVSRDGNDNGIGKLAEFIDKVKDSIEGLQRAVKITSFGIDYKEYVKFNILTPTVTRFIGGNVDCQIRGERKWTNENCQYCIDFVVKSALNLQEFDFDIDTLEVDRFKQIEL
ncbi:MULTISPECIES: hypothetical protein [Winogradskyella]|uniref:hypothetical protein n=1 Tax=Winogradskyella TaxID=286104 RepID=UPI0015CC0880|nr:MULTISPECIES: hypothetical protein [Winogradskyella]QXP78808.1 hypothetical protein H0I32_16625 [Winogradskyella sp. HaHa_3_26]